jgi:hypothetical protein
MSVTCHAVLLCTLLIAGQACAQTAAETQAPPVPPKYRVEVILFAHNDANSNEERFDALEFRANPPPVAAAIAPPLAIEAFEGVEGPRAAIADGFPAPGDLSQEADPSVAGDALNAATADSADPFETINPFGRLDNTPDLNNDAAPPFAFRLLRADEFDLTSELRVIERLGAYRLLGYGGWVQDGLEETQSHGMNLSNLGIANPRGSLRLYLGRFLHVAVDVDYQAPSPVRVTDGNDVLLAPIETGQWYKLKTERNAIRSGELHYIDHPMFGVLLRVLPVEDEPDVIDDDTDVLAPAA